MTTHSKIRYRSRRGAVLPLFALLLPVFFIFCGLAINTAYMKLAQTETKIATDAAAHAGGRAMSIHQTTQAAIDEAIRVGALNSVAGEPFVITNENLVGFGYSRRDDNGFGRYAFTEVQRSQIDSGTRQANSVSVLGSIQIPLLLPSIPGYSQVSISEYSIATQVDRDIALVLDRSGSMMTYKDESALNSSLRSLYRAGRISYSEWYNAINYQDFTTNVVNRLTGDEREFAHDRRHNSSEAPRHSRWAQLEDAVNAFCDVLEETDQEELVSVATFATNARLDLELSLDYAPIRSLVEGTLPNGWTAIGQGIQQAVPSIMTAAAARPFAAKTIVILTDGINNQLPDPRSVATQLMSQYNVTIHTVTFTDGADQSAMTEVAEIGGGRHYHADTGEELVEIFEEIANNLPTILTE